METIKMFGPCISDPSRIVNRDIAACDEQAYVRAGYKRGSVPEEVSEAPPVETEPLTEPVAPKPRKKKGQN